MMAVKNMKYDYDSEILKYVKNQTPSICLEAVKQNKDALLYVDYEYLEDVRKMIND